MDIYTYSLKLKGLSVLRGVLDEPFIAAFSNTLDALKKDETDFAECYGKLCFQYFSSGDASKTVLDAVHFDVNPLNSKPEPSDLILKAATNDIEALNLLLSLDSGRLKASAFGAFSEAALLELPDFPASKPLPFKDGRGLYEFYCKNGFGAFAKASAFTVRDGGRLEAVTNPDPIRLSDLPGYEIQKRQIIRNTLAFLDGREANNILLYGDKGTGKSSTVKAIANEYSNRGLKIIELPPRFIKHFPKIFEAAAGSPFKFLLFLDDLSFSQEDENFAALKAFIEGGLANRPENLVIYATSNRRHLIRESMADRQGDEVRVRDTLETVSSLSDRFGLEITFSVPDKEEYLSIVDALSKEAGIDLPESEVKLLAERFALRRNGRSPRTARQFISQLLAERYSQ